MDRLTKELRQAGKLRMAAIREMRHATRSTLSECASMRGEMAREYRAQTQKFLASLAKEVAAQRHAAVGQIAQTQKFLAAQFKGVAAGRHATGNSIARMKSSRRKAAGPMRTALQQQVETLKQKSDELRADAAQTVRKLASANEKMAKQQRSALAAERRKLRTHVASFLKTIHADQMKAHDIWKAFGTNGGATGK
jgi:septal ring factor EnvC (AmiA/AmiB activator)